MRDDIITSLGVISSTLDAAYKAAQTTIADLTSDLQSAGGGEERSELALLEAIKGQLGAAGAEVERFASNIDGRLGVARMYVRSLAVPVAAEEPDGR